MCCKNDPKIVKKLQAKFKNKKYIKVYKIVEVTYDGNVITPYQRASVNAGWNVSNTTKKSVSLKDTKVERGIHVWLEPISQAWCDSGDRRITCYALPSDLLAARYVIDNGRCNFHLVFKKIYIPKKSLRRLTSNLVNGKMEPNPCA
jgi:hypothetical protein